MYFKVEKSKGFALVNPLTAFLTPPPTALTDVLKEKYKPLSRAKNTFKGQ